MKRSWLQKMMTKHDFNDALRQLSMTPRDVHRLFGIAERNARHMAAGQIEVPWSIEFALHLMRKHNIKPGDLARERGYEF